MKTKSLLIIEDKIKGVKEPEEKLKLFNEYQEEKARLR